MAQQTLTLDASRTQESSGEAARRQTDRVTRVLVVRPDAVFDPMIEEHVDHLIKLLTEWKANWQLVRIGCHSSRGEGLRGAVQRRFGRLRAFGRQLFQADLVHIVCGDEFGVTREGAALIMARFMGKRVVLDCRGQTTLELMNSLGPLRLSVLRLCDQVVVGSEFVANHLNRQGVRASSINDGIELERSQSRGINRLQPAILACARRGDFTVTAVALRGFTLVKQKYPRAEMTLIGSTEDLPHLQGVVNRSRTSGVRLMPATGRDEVDELCSRHDVLLLPSREQLPPYGLMRALSLGLPVVSALSESGIVIDGVNGLGYSEHSPGELADRLIRLVEEPELVTRLSREAVRTSRRFDQSQRAEHWRQLYAHLLPGLLTA